MSAVKITNFKKYFGNTKAVDNISFEVQENEIFGYLGPNGAGKTTTISCMMAFTHPTAGNISIFGQDAQASRTCLKSMIGYLSADVNLYKNLTGQDHLDLIQKIRGKSEILPKLIRDFELDPKAKAGRLSTGNRQKLAIIMALMNEPKLLILDEPTRGLDPILQKMMYEYILDFKAKGATIFMSSHILPEVEKLCDHVGIIKKGKLINIETIASLRQKRLNTVRAFFEKRVPLKTFDILEGVEQVEKLNHNGISFKVKGDINQVLKTLSKYQINYLEITHADLEEIFMEYYK